MFASCFMMEWEWIADFEEGNWRSKSLISFIYEPQDQLLKNSVSSDTEFFDTWLFCKKDGIDWAHIAFYRNPAFQNNTKPVLLLGNFESLPDESIALALLDRAIQYAKNQGFSKLIGPMNGSTWASHRFNICGSNPLFFTEVPQPLTYLNYWKKSGFLESDFYYSFIQELDPNQFQFVNPSTKQRLIDMQIQIKSLNMNRFEEEMEEIYEFSLKVFKENSHYSPVSKEGFMSRYLPIRHLLDPRFVLQAFSEKGERIALFFCLHDFYDSSGKTLIVKTIARLPDSIYSGISHWLYEQIQTQALALGYERIVHAFVHENNRSRTISEGYRSRVIRTYALFERSVEA